MPRGRPKKKIEKATIKKVEVPKIEAPKVTEKMKKAEEATKNLQSKLLTQSQLKTGGSWVRSRYAQEAGYVASLEEVNELRIEAGLSKIQGLGALRKK